MNKMEGKLNVKSNISIDLTADQDLKSDDNIESYIQEVNIEDENVYIHEVKIEQILARKYRKELMNNNSDVFTVKNLGCFKYVIKKISNLSFNNICQESDDSNKSNELDVMDVYNEPCENYLSDVSESDEQYSQYINIENNDEECDDNSNESSSFNSFITYENNSSDVSEVDDHYSHHNIRLQRNYEESVDSNESGTLNIYSENDLSGASGIDESDSQYLNLKRSYEECNTSNETSNSNTDDEPDRKLKRLNDRSGSSSSLCSTSYSSTINNIKIQDTNNVIVSNDEVNQTVNLLDSSDDEDNSETCKLALPKVSDVKNLNKIVFIPSPRPNKIFPGYNEEVLNKLKNFVANKTLQDLVHTNENKLCPIRIDDLLRVFMPDNWLNDLVIQYYLELLINSSKNKILNLTSFFMESIKTHNKVPEKCYKNKNIFSYDKIIVPVFNNNHWTLIVVDIRAREIIHFNSFDFILHNEISIMKLFLKLAYEDQKQPGDEDEIFWTDCNGNSPIQNNQNDCGVFICTNARYRLLDKPSNFSQEDIPLLRQRITYEIVYNILLPT